MALKEMKARVGSLRSKIKSNMKDISHLHEDRRGSGNSIIY